MQIKTSDLIDLALDWAVAKCEGFKPFTDGISWIIEDAGDYRQLPRYSTDREQGGQIIEREYIQLIPDQGATYFECTWFAGSANEDGDEFNGEGPTVLIAAMRCFVSSRLGDEVDVPEELLINKENHE